jgi:hypothetical protein
MKRHAHKRRAGCGFRLAACLGLILTLVALPGAAEAGFFNEGGMDVPAIPMSGVQPAASCDVSLKYCGHHEGWSARHGTMAMVGDGGWCVLQFVQLFRHQDINTEITVGEPPSHGEVHVERLPGVERPWLSGPPRRLAVVYRPTLGYVGADRMAVWTGADAAHNSD